MFKSQGCEVRLAATPDERAAAQRLRYRMFYEVRGIVPPPEILAQGRDRDRFDDYCDHLIAVTRNAAGETKVIGNYRLLKGSVARKHCGFISATEFDLAPLDRFDGEVLELGRACVDPDHRSNAVIQLLWKGIADYVVANRIGLLFGGASLPGTDAGEFKNALSYLHHYHAQKADWAPAARARSSAPLKQLKLSEVDVAAAVREMPALIKGYLRLGGTVGRDAFIDLALQTIDVCMLVETAKVTGRYARHFLPAIAAADRPLPEKAA